MESTAPLTRLKAYQKWEHLSDTHLRIKYAQDAACNIPGGDLDRFNRCRRLLEAGGSPDVLVLFFEETKDLTWPGTFGQTPWETASTIGYALWRIEQGTAFAPGSLHGDMIAHYQAAQAAMADEAESAAPTP